MDVRIFENVIIAMADTREVVLYENNQNNRAPDCDDKFFVMNKLSEEFHGSEISREIKPFDYRFLACLIGYFSDFAFRSKKSVSNVANSAVVR